MKGSEISFWNSHRYIRTSLGFWRDIFRKGKSLAAKILVTGGAGFIGSHLVDGLLKEGREVTVLDDFNDYYEPGIKRANVREHLKHKNYELVEGDIRDRTLLTDLFQKRGIGRVVHLAARAGIRASLSEPLIYEDVNVRGLINLLEVSFRAGIEQFIFGSSSSVYGCGMVVPFREEQTLSEPISPYAATKRAGELFLHVYHHLYKVPVTILRFFTVYGPRQRPEMAIHKFARLIYKEEQIPVFGDGSSKRDYTYISDIIGGVMVALKKVFAFETFNLGSSVAIELRRLIYLLEKETGKKAKAKYLPPQPGDAEVTCADVGKAQKLLGYKPAIEIEEGIARFIRWYREENER